jgi:hypothetical protein
VRPLSCESPSLRLLASAGTQADYGTANAFELPAFGKLVELARHVRAVVDRRLFDSVLVQLSDKQRRQVDQLLESDQLGGSGFNALSDHPNSHRSRISTIWSAKRLIVRSGWSFGINVSGSMNANMLACFLVRPRTVMTSVVGALTVPA